MRPYGSRRSSSLFGVALPEERFVRHEPFDLLPPGAVVSIVVPLVQRREPAAWIDVYHLVAPRDQVVVLVLDVRLPLLLRDGKPQRCLVPRLDRADEGVPALPAKLAVLAVDRAACLLRRDPLGNPNA